MIFVVLRHALGIWRYNFSSCILAALQVLSSAVKMMILYIFYFHGILAMPVVGSIVYCIVQTSQFGSLWVRFYCNWLV